MLTANPRKHPVGLNVLKPTIRLGLSRRRAEVFHFLFAETCKNGYQPSYAEIMEEFGFASKTTVIRHFDALRRRGMIGDYRMGARRVEIRRNPDGSEFKGFAPRGDKE